MFFMYYKRDLLGKGMRLFPVLIIKASPPPAALMIILRFCWKRMVLGAQLMTKTTNKSTTYFQGVTVFVFIKLILIEIFLLNNCNCDVIAINFFVIIQLLSRIF